MSALAPSSVTLPQHGFAKSARPRGASRAAASGARTALDGLDRLDAGLRATRLTLVGSDLLALAITAGVTAGLQGLSTSTFGPLEVLALMGFVTIVYAFSGAYRQLAVHPAAELRRMTGLTLALFATAATAAFLHGDHPLALHLAIGGALAATIVPGGRLFSRILWARRPWWGVPVAVLAPDDDARTVLAALRRWPELGLRPVALVSSPAGALDASPAGGDGYAQPPSPPSLAAWSGPPAGPPMAFGRDGDELVLAHRYGIRTAIVSAPDVTHRSLAVRLERLSRYFERIVVITSTPGAPALWTSAPGSDALVGYSVRDGQAAGVGRLVKRGIDAAGALLGLIVLSPLLAAVAIAVRMDSAGPVLFHQHRMGLRGHCFSVLKFRTMHVDAERRLDEVLREDPARRAEYDAFHKLSDDPRVTAVGRILRRLSLDELPQLWNVLIGEMSLVGPRAYVPREISEMGGLERVVLQSPPGITGLWQVSGRNALRFEERVQVDVHYVQNASVWLDLYILARTIPVVLSGDGAS